MTDARRIVIVGGGPAGVGAALAARAQDASAEILLISDANPANALQKVQAAAGLSDQQRQSLLDRATRITSQFPCP